MSKYISCETTYTDLQSIKDTLVEFGVNLEDIEVHQESVVMDGYHGTSENIRAHILIKKGTKGLHNRYDVGFELTKNGYQPRVCDMDIHSGVGQFVSSKSFKRAYSENLVNRWVKDKRFSKTREQLKDKVRIRVSP